jgi:hypothetical protein
MEQLTLPSVPISWGELLDKITILEIKRERIGGSEAQAHVVTELEMLEAVATKITAIEGVAPLFKRLKRINTVLWDVEDAIREQEEDARFGPRFVALARSVYKTNDERAAIKREINLLLGSELIEEKSYAGSAAPT